MMLLLEEMDETILHGNPAICGTNILAI